MVGPKILPALFALLCTLADRAGSADRHWAYVAPRRPAPPDVSDARWARNEIDRFVLARMDRANLRPSPPADRARLIRRLWLDLVGLPPSVAVVDAFVADDSPDAWSRAVSRLLASPAYGERWARPWLDAARHADSNGFQRDGHRSVWAYRDWVIDAMNADMPFDRFTIEQLAGDLMPNRTLAQRIATGFHRGTTVNTEAGVDQEQNRVNAIIDRVNTTGTVWLGTSIECAQCHNHKYDPFTQKEYYALFAFFNGTEVETKAGANGSRRVFTGPRLELPRAPEARREIETLRARRAELDGKNKQDRVEIAKIDRRIEELAPTTLVMLERDEPRVTRVFKRGNFLTQGEEVSRDVPSALHAWPANAPRNRFGLARWITDRRNPLTARVAVNRWWAEFFGRGIVESLEDFGSQSTPPTHPDLLDWLAVELVENGWSMKHVHRLIVSSATYRQSSAVSPELLRRDPYNALLTRAPRLRLDAERIRDNGLAIAGLLSLKMGGPPIRPPQPKDVWRVTGEVDNTYRTSTGEDRHRRGIYVVWRRSSPYPSFVNFDAPDRAACCVSRPRTNTPLQALTLLNDPVWFDMALAFAANVLSERACDGLGSDRERVRFAFRLCVARDPGDEELDRLVAALERERLSAESDTDRVRELLRGRTTPDGVSATEYAAWFHIATVLLNLDETITRN